MTDLPVTLAAPAKPKDRFLRWISPKHASRFRLGQLDDALSLTVQSLVVSRDKRLCYIKNAKAGCSTLTSIMYQYDHGRASHDPHGEKTVQQGLRYWESNLAAARGDIMIFSFVRHPVDRVRSAFINFFVDEKNEHALKHMPGMLARGLNKRQDIEYKFDVFLSYIQDSLLLNEKLTDTHWRPQIYNTGVTEFRVGFVGKIEDGIDKGLETVAELSGLEIPKSGGRSINASSRTTFQPTRDQRSKLERLYSVDFERFGY